MPYEISFSRNVEITNRDNYINECCVGGDVIINALLPFVKARYPNIDSGQEDWGWYIWFTSGNTRLEIDVSTDDGDAGEFRIRLTSRIKKFIGYKEVHSPILDELRALVETELVRTGALNVRSELVEPD